MFVHGWNDIAGAPPLWADNVVLEPGETVSGSISLSIHDFIAFIDANDIDTTQDHTFTSYFAIVYEQAR